MLQAQERVDVSFDEQRDVVIDASTDKPVLSDVEIGHRDLSVHGR